MPNATDEIKRTLKHTRSIKIDVFSREDRLWDLDAHFSDIKTHDLVFKDKKIDKGTPIHHFLLRTTVNQNGDVLAVKTIAKSVPFWGQCDSITPAYQALVGLNIFNNFRKDLREKLSGIAGCTHLNELAGVLPTVAIQTITFSDVKERTSGKQSETQEKPFELDSCHALRTEGPIVATYYPRWAK